MADLIPKPLFHKLMENHWAMFYLADFERNPVVKLFSENANCTWLLSYINHEIHNIAYGLVDTGNGSPEMKELRIKNLESIGDVKIDESFTPRYIMDVYEEAAKMCGKITEDEEDLKKAKQRLLQQNTPRQ